MNGCFGWTHHDPERKNHNSPVLNKFRRTVNFPIGWDETLYIGIIFLGLC
jgi:hypothetical protein